jgi:DNA-binding CsgD family transcriptional regulator
MDNVNPKLIKFINGPVIKGDEKLATLLIEADALPDCALYNPDFCNASFPYAGKNLISIAGFSAEELMSRGAKLIFERTLPADLPHLTARQTMYMQMVAQPDFDLATVLIQHFRFALTRSAGERVKVHVTGVILNFNENREFRVGIGFILRDEPEYTPVLKTCQALLSKIKDRHNRIWEHQVIRPGDGPYLIQYVDQVYHAITLREREVLAWLAKGLSTKEAALKMMISDHTVESHRKHLLEKFGAKNSVELIKKASKVFWLE